MNGTESRYAGILEIRKRAGHIARYDFQPVKLRLADNTFYTPDFRVILPDGLQEMHEVKGFMRDDAAVKIKVAAEQHPYVFKLIREKRGTFTIDTV